MNNNDTNIIQIILKSHHDEFYKSNDIKIVLLRKLSLIYLDYHLISILLIDFVMVTL